MGFRKFGASILKNFIRIVISCFLIVFGAVFILQLPLTKSQIKRWIQRSASEHGVELHIDKLDGNLPFEWTLKGVSLRYQHQDIHVGEVRMRLSILPLFKKRFEVSYLKCDRGNYGGIPFEGHAQGVVDLAGKHPISITHFLIEGDDLFVRLEGSIDQKLTMVEGNLAFQIPDLGIFSPDLSSGLAMGIATVERDIAHIECFANDLSICNQPLAKTSIKVDATRSSSIWQGRALLASGHAEIPVDGTFDFQYTPGAHIISVDDFVLNGPDMKCFGKIDLDPAHKCLEGTIYAQVLDLRNLRPLIPESYIRGRLGAKIEFQSFSTFQDVSCQLEVEEAAYFDQACEALTVETHFYDLFGDLRGEFSIEGRGGKFDQIHLDDFDIKSTFEPNASPFVFSVKGSTKEPFHAQGKGNWQKRGKGVYVLLNDFTGQALNSAIALKEPFNVEWTPSSFKMSQLAMDVGSGTITSQIDLSENTSLIKLKAKEFPLELIPLRNPHMSLTGNGDFDIDLLSWQQQLQGHCNVALKRAVFLTDGSKTPLVTKGSMQVHLQNNKAQVFTEVKARDDQFIHLIGTFPILYNHYPFNIRLNPDETLSGQLVAEGNIEDLLNFINVGHHRIEGWVSTKLNLSRTLRDFCLRGDIEVQDAVYENYYTGTHLKHVFASASAVDKAIKILELSAEDNSGGKAHATGTVSLDLERKLPFKIQAEIQDLDTVSFDTITGKFTGNLSISGDKNGSKARGNLTVSHATFRIPDSLPTALPELPIKFINPPEIIARGKIASPSVSPMQLDLKLDVPSKAFVEGRGMNAELKGKLHITGTYTDIVAKGKLQLLTGEYIFSGKVFDLTSGELIFKDKPTPSAYISVSGNCDLPDVNVSIALRGPLSSPKLTFNSSPQLSTSSLLSQILFNKDVSEINAAQALQLAQTVISLSGNSAPDILEKIRKSLGIDRLTIVTSENDPSKISLQIGKYLMRGVLLTLSQGAESRNVSVEVDLKKGLRFQAEVDESQQGKFSLKWHHHY